MSQGLVGKVAAASGLSSIFADRSIARAIRRAGVEPETLTRAELKTCLPELEKMLATFMEPGEVVTRMGAIRKLAE